MTVKEKEINLKLEEAQKKYFKENKRLQNGAIGEVNSTRLDVLDALERYADSEGKIDRRKIQAILRELGAAEDKVEQDLMNSIEDTIDKTSDRAIKTSTVALGALIVSSMIPTERIKNKVSDSIIEQKASDGLTLRDRLWRMSGGLVDEIRTDIRAGIIQGKSIVSIGRDVKRTFDKGEWKIRRLIMTEGYNAYRETIGEVAEEVGSDIIKGVKIIDNRGRHPYHKHHECYRLAEQDMYGWGKGVYRPQDYFIYNPHPQCTAYFHFVLVNDTEEKRR